MERREFLVDTARLIAAWSLLGAAVARGAFASRARPTLRAWLKEVDEMSRDLKHGGLRQVDWQERIEALFARIEPAELARQLDLQRLVGNLRLPDRGVATEAVRIPKVADLDRRQFGVKLFAMGRGRAIIPHGHDNMVSMHYVVSGRFHVRHYQRLSHEQDHMELEATIDRHAGPGEASTISDERDNVHWLVAETDHAYTLDVLVTGLDPDLPGYRLHYLDPAAAESLADGTLRVPVIPVAKGLELYG